ncbi:hypothetical protein F2Q69_00024603 [Brassica cretica]|uniref:Uncharacterized protein n=1 Tax=Brassica cretica TaxID=69181 RepID=A0A8S9Q7I8_BRACR|nr:hypothetical protein F2Q69_00024603 [Brassica cretica]
MIEQQNQVGEKGDNENDSETNENNNEAENNGTEAGSMRWMGDGSILSMEIVIGWEDGEYGRLAVLSSPNYPENKGRTMSYK